jgi:hypothetical protein
LASSLPIAALSRTSLTISDFVPNLHAVTRDAVKE